MHHSSKYINVHSAVGIQVKNYKMFDFLNSEFIDIQYIVTLVSATMLIASTSGVQNFDLGIYYEFDVNCMNCLNIQNPRRIRSERQYEHSKVFMIHVSC